MILNFETGSLASFTIVSDGVATAVGAWETKIAAGTVKIGGVVVKDLGQFVISDAGALGTTIKLDDGSYSSWIGGYGVSDPAMDADPDGDGMNNLMEYALGGNPTHNDAVAVLPVFQTLGNDFFHVHNERTDDSNLTYTEGRSPSSRVACTTCATISPALKLRVRPVIPLAQNVQPKAQPA